jgi:thiamine phosphate synthase YjbQ (UPF0047 family)
MEGFVDRRMKITKQIQHAARTGTWQNIILANRARDKRIKTIASE